MDTSTWILVYDLAQQDRARSIDIAYAIGTVLVVALLWWWPRLRWARWGSLVALVLLAVLGLRAWEQHTLLAALRDGRATVVQGPVQDAARELRTWKRTGESAWRRTTAEAITVAGVRFGWTQDADAPGFRNLGAPEWTPADGDVLRVHFVETAGDDPMARRIVRLERLAPVSGRRAIETARATPPAQP